MKPETITFTLAIQLANTNTVATFSELATLGKRCHLINVFHMKCKESIYGIHKGFIYLSV